MATAAGWDAFLVKYRALNYHLLYALALEKREAMRATASLTPPAPAPDPTPAPATRNSSPVEIPPPAAAETPTKPASNATAWQAAALPRTKKAAARAIQTILGESACYSGPADGIFGRNSRAGLARYGNQAGITLDTGASPSLFELQGVLVALSQNPGFDCSATPPARQKPTNQVNTPPRVTTAPAAPRTAPAVTKTVPRPAPTVQTPPKVGAPPVSYAGRGGQQLGRTGTTATSSGAPKAPVTYGGRGGQQLPRND